MHLFEAKVGTSRCFREFFALFSWNPTPLQGKKLPEAATLTAPLRLPESND
jgi:hypothetical protein